MMHGSEKSDPVIVAGKPSMHWTQSQGRVSQALERIRHTPEVGAVCGKAARTDLCGGREVTRVPTAKALCCPAPSLEMAFSGHCRMST
jgi:hypothetical protein